VFAFVTAETLDEKCKAVDKAAPTVQDGYDYQYCGGYLMGVIDHIDFDQHKIDGNGKPLQKTPLCLPDNWTIREAILVYRKFVKEHPEQLHLPAAVVTFNAFGDVYYCRPK
jgi:hypothetical protein